MIRFYPLIFVLAAMAALTACSPVFDWRDMRVGPATAAVVLPCKKPTHTEREVPLGDLITTLSVAGCKAGGATFAVMTTRLGTSQPAGEVDELLAGWQQATLRNMQVSDAQVQRAPFRPLGGLALPHAQHLVMQAHDATGQPVHAQAAWTAHADPDGRLMLLHAVMLSKRKQDHDIDLFFESIRW